MERVARLQPLRFWDVGFATDLKDHFINLFHKNNTRITIYPGLSEMEYV